MNSHHELEYKIIHEQRLALWRQMHTWDQICLPLSVAVFSALSAAIWTIGHNSWAAFGVAYGIAFLLLLFWRRNAHTFDDAVVGFYPRIIELERELELEFYFQYLFSHLRKGVKEKVCVEGRIEPRKLDKLPSALRNAWDDFREWAKWMWTVWFSTSKANNMDRLKEENKEKFIELVREGGAKVLDSRGHFDRDLMVAFLSPLCPFIILALVISGLWLGCKRFGEFLGKLKEAKAGVL